MASSRRAISILVGVLLAAVAVGGLVIWLLPSQPDTSAPPAEQFGSQLPPSGQFDTSVLQRSEYLRLDQQLIQEGAIPVQPPAVVGKANPFL